MQIKRVRKESGFSLIEIMIAVALLSIGLLAVGSGEIAALTINRRTTETMQAVAAAENMIELMRRNPADIVAYNNLNTNNATTTPVTDAQIAFNSWKEQVEKISNSVANGGVPFNCGGVNVTNACGAVTFITGAANAISGVTTVIVTIVWPARPAGITLRSAIVS